MRPTFVASLLLSPILCATSAVASQPKSDVPATRQVSTGLTEPVILDNASIRIPPDALGLYVAGEAKVVVSLNVDEKGDASSVRVVKSVNPAVDAYVVDGVLHSHFRPATLDNKPVAVPLNLVVRVLR